MQEKISDSGELKIRLTAIWALSESALGGVLHALRIPFTGLVVSGVAMAIIVLLARLGEKRSGLFGAMMVVLVIKAVVSPHSPPTAYLAIAFQSSLGFILFALLKKSDLTLILFAVIVLVESGLQKLITLTLVFGENLWRSIDILAHLLIKQFHLTAILGKDVSISHILIIVYLGMHLLSGFLMALWVRSFATYVNNHKDDDIKPIAVSEPVINMSFSGKKRKKIFRFSYLIYPLAVVLVIFSYFLPVLEKNIGIQAMVMIVRSLVILIIWYKFLARYVQKAILKYIHRNKVRYHSEINDTLEILPVLKNIVFGQWKRYRADKQTSFKRFVEDTLLLLLLTPIQ